ncbi:MAG: prepilin-type N-terminal cleavage/methylation domain-containing protein [Tenericutes bacterium]|nr:prepilin-type N-terminal cleavage/methylation domain-containing protein [Mycoplasmatota bacterium]
MKKNAFTLVELLAVIAILAILIIIALPNILKMFNNAKGDVFVTELKTVTSAAEKRFLDSQISGGNETTFCRSESDSLNPLNMSGAEKYYYVKLNNKGRIKYAVVWDDEKFIKYKYTSSNSIANLSRNDITANDNVGIDCETVIEELDVNPVTPISAMELSLKLSHNNSKVKLDIKLLDSEDLEWEVFYEIYRVDPETGHEEFVTDVERTNNNDEFAYTYYEPMYVCSYAFRVDAHYNDSRIKQEYVEVSWCQ